MLEMASQRIPLLITPTAHNEEEIEEGAEGCRRGRGAIFLSMFSKNVKSVKLRICYHVILCGKFTWQWVKIRPQMSSF
jgi:hypothetical protein